MHSQGMAGPPAGNMYQGANNVTPSKVGGGKSGHLMSP